MPHSVAKRECTVLASDACGDGVVTVTTVRRAQQQTCTADRAGWQGDGSSREMYVGYVETLEEERAARRRRVEEA